MEPISIILDALAIGLKETAPEIVREAYNNLKYLIRMKLVDKPDTQMVLAKYESNSQA